MRHAHDFHCCDRLPAAYWSIALLAGLSVLTAPWPSLVAAQAPQASADSPAIDRLRPDTAAPRSSAADAAAGWDVSSQISYKERGVPISAKILRYAQRLVAQYDTNHDGQLEKDEWQKMHGNPAIVDRDHDGLISAEDLARYITIYGRYRRIQLIAPTLATSPQQPSGEGTPAAGAENSRGENPAGRNGPVDISPAEAVDAASAARASAARTSSAARSPTEVSSAPSAAPNSEAPAAADSGPQSSATTTGSQPLTPLPPPAAAVARRTAAGQRFFVPPVRLPQGVPPWFIARDLDGDGQLTLSEFAPNASQADIEEFSRYDINHDGVITAEEVLQFGKQPGNKGQGAEGRAQGTEGRGQIQGAEGRGVREHALSPEGR